MKRIATNDTTDALMAAMERAEIMEHVLILYQTKPEHGEENGGHNIGAISSGELTTAGANWLVDVYKNWLMHRSSGDDNNE